MADKQGDFFDDYKNDETALKVNDGVKQPPLINPYLQNRPLRRRTIMSVDEYMAGIEAGDTTILSQAITLVESLSADHRKVADEIIARCQAVSA
ncbi:MAG: hypothetical protein II143_07110, partial [Bacteroidales bacterium]|nr:hypothetical protein [Bacteroidales bacterium]